LIKNGIKDYNHDFGNKDAIFFWPDYYEPKIHNLNFLKSASALLVCFSCQQNLFPIYSELEKKNNAECKKGFALATSLIFCLYITLSGVSVYMFGKGIKGSVLDNVGEECIGHDTCPWESYVTRFLFMLVLACHIPFVFFSGKESILIIIDELDRKSISQVLELRIKMLANDSCSE